MLVLVFFTVSVLAVSAGGFGYGQSVYFLFSSYWKQGIEVENGSTHSGFVLFV